jgi:hypothetical protein
MFVHRMRCTRLTASNSPVSLVETSQSTARRIMAIETPQMAV